MIAAFLVAGERGLVLEGDGLVGVPYDEGAVGDLGLEDAPGAGEEDEGVVVGGGAGVQVEVVALAGGLADEELTPRLAYGEAVEGHVVVDGVGAEDEAVIGDDLDACGAGLVGGGGGSGSVLRADYDYLGAGGDQRLDVGLLLGGVALGEEDLVGMPAVLKAASNLVWSWIQRGSSLVGKATPIWTWAKAMDPRTVMNSRAVRTMEARFIRYLLWMLRAARGRARYLLVSRGL